MSPNQSLSLAINTLKTLSIDAVQKANSGHPGLPMGAATYAFLMWYNNLRFSPTNPQWIDRDRFVLSAGHGSAMLYSLLHLFGFPLTMDDLKHFRQLGSKTPGHPEYHPDLGIETTTGPLGQGISNAIGMALAGKMMAARFNTKDFSPITRKIYVIASDGDLMEGVASEASSLAGHLALNNLVVFYDSNGISIDGDLRLSFSEEVKKRYEAYGWDVFTINGHSIEEVETALERAKSPTVKPLLVVTETTIGHGSPNKAGTADAHGSPLGDAEVALTKKNIGWTYPDPFTVPDQVRELCNARIAELEEEYAVWQGNFSAWRERNPELAITFDRFIQKDIPANLAETLLAKTAPDAAATRNICATVQNALASSVPSLVGGSADLTPSTLTYIDGSEAISLGKFTGKNLHFGIREHGMAAVCNGMAEFGGLIPYCSTFLVFCDYMKPAIRLAALSNVQTLFIFSHDSIFLGEDGPTHQPIEHLGSLRLIPNLRVFRPYNYAEMVFSWVSALERKNGPAVLVTTRQKLNFPKAYNAQAYADIAKGGYVLRREIGNSPTVTLIATGSEVALALQTAETLAQAGGNPRVVSVPCREIFLAQGEAYILETLGSAPRVVVEASNDHTWYRLLRQKDLFYGIERYGASAKLQDLEKAYGFTPDQLASRISALLA